MANKIGLQELAMNIIKYQNKDGTYLPESSWAPFNTKTYTPHQSTRYINVCEEDKEKKTLPELYLEREECCGCTACFATCPKDAILMQEDEEGFLYPVVDAAKCVRCYKCISVCAFKAAQRKEFKDV